MIFSTSNVISDLSILINLELSTKQNTYEKIRKKVREKKNLES